MNRRYVFLLFLASWLPALADAQPAGQAGPPVPALTLDQAIQYATDHYPAIRAALEQASAASAGVDLARSAYLPRLDALWQTNRGTANNIFGQVLPQSVIPALTGPVLPSTSSRSVWGSATGALLSWDAFDFGLRHATIEGAEAGVAQARAAQTLTRLDVQSRVAQAFFAVVVAQQTVVAARADLDRRDVLLQSVRVLVDNQLRPGFDASRALAEQAAARTRVSQSQEALALANASLLRALGRAGGTVTVEGTRFLQRVPPGDVPAPPAPPAAHPLALVRRALLEQARSSEAVLAHSNLPRIVLQSGVFARGSGASPDGVFDAGAGGLKLDRANWSAGVQVVIPNLFGFAALGAQKASAAASERATAASYEEALLAITSEQETAAALLQGAREIAAYTPVQLAAARETEARARARYDAGLASIVEVADAQGLLAQSELQDGIARVDVWRALLAAAAARGDLAPFLDLVRQP